MPGRYTAPGTLTAVASGAKTIINIVQGATPRTRPIVFGVMLGYNGTPADNAMLADLVGMDATGAGSGGSAITPAPMDAGDPASNLTVTENFATTEPTAVTRTLAEFPGHQRTTIFVQLAEENGWVLTGTASHKIGARTLHASYTGAASATLYYRE